MIKERLRRLITWEVYKIKKRGLWCIPALFNFICYFYFVPLAFYSIYEYLPWQNVHAMYSVGTCVFHLIFQVSYNLFYIALYVLKVEKFKVNPDKWPWEDNKNFVNETKNLIKTLMINSLVVLPIITGIFGKTVKYETRPKMPEFQETVLQIAFFILCESFYSHWTHVLFHEPSLYGKYHKQHHDYRIVIAATSEYAHPAEYIIVNSLSLAVGPFLYGQSNVHIITWYTWLIFRLASSTDAHSGYEFPFSPFHFIPFGTTSEYHNYHHFKNIGTYGSYVTIWDTIFGSDEAFHKYLEKNNKIKAS